MPTISAFTEGVVVPQYNTTDFSNDLEVQLLLKKQSEYNSIVARLGNMRNTALNINMLNVKGQQRLNEYNDSLQEMLSEDLGDLTDPKVQSRVSSFFTQISQDRDLKQRSRLSSHYQQQLDMINQMRVSKDPVKSGYNQINETVFRKWTGGLEDFALADNVDNWEIKMQSYVPFKDVDQKLVNMVKLLHAESQTTQKPVTQRVNVGGKQMEVPTGYDVLESSTGVSSERIRQLLESTLDADELAQMDILSKYRIIQTSGSPDGLRGLYYSYNNWLQRENRNTRQQLAQIQSIKKQLDPARIDPSLSEEEKVVREAAYKLELERLSEQEVYLQTALSRQITNQFTEEEWMKQSPEEILPFVRQLTIESYVNGISDSLSWKSTIEKVGMDETYFANLKIKNMQDRLSLDAELGRAGLRLRELKLLHDIEKDKKQNGDWRPGADIIKSPTEVFTSWENFTNISKQYLDRTTPIITSKTGSKYDLNPKNLLDRRWLNANQDNHEVRLWNIYSSRFRDEGAFLDENRTQPNIAGFELFKTQVKNGDFKKDPAITDIWSKYQDDQDVTQYFVDKSGRIAETINKVSGIGDMRLPGGKNSLRDYAVKNGWTGEGEMVFGIPDGKGGFKQMSWSEIKEEYNRGKLAERVSLTFSTQISNPGAALLGRISQSVDPEGKQMFYQGILKNDPEFLELVSAAVEQEENSAKMIRDVFLEEMPQWLQGNQQTTESKSLIDMQIPRINSTAMKYVDEDEPLGLSVEDVVQVTRPEGIGTKAYFMLTKEGAKKLNDQGRKLRTLEGNIDSDVTGNTWYEYESLPVNPLDHIYNAMFEDTGEVKRNIGGYEVMIRDVRNSPTINLIIKGPQGTATVPVERKDTQLIFKVAEQYINQLENQTVQPR